MEGLRMVRPTEFGTNSVKGFSMTGGVALSVRVHVPWRALASAVLVSLLVGVVLYARLVAGSGPLAAPVASSPGAARVASEARASISEELGLDIPAYHLTPNVGGFRAGNAAQHLHIDFTRAGVTLSPGGGQLGLSLRAEGSGSSLRAVGAVGPELERSNRVAYAHKGITEWYVNGPLGLEQGFSIARAPVSAGALTLAIDVSGASRIALAAGGQSALLRDAGGNELRYGGLSARDASGRELRTWMTLDGQLLLLHVDARGARFPLVVDPMVETAPEQELNAGSERLSAGSSGDPAERSRFGWSVALSGEGDTALVGAPGEDNGVGAAWIFIRSANGWIQQGEKLTIPEKAVNGQTCSEEHVEGGGEPEEEGEEAGAGEVHPCRFGRSVALSADGNTAVIGAPRENGNTGAVWIFTRSGSSWTPGSELPSPEAESKWRFGTSVAVSADGGTLAVGAPRLNGGRVWTFTRSGSSWSPLGGPLTGAGEVGDGLFGQSVALSADGETILVGAPGDSEQQGAAWGFKRSGADWADQGTKLTGGSPSPEARFGSSVALSGDASTALVGARGADNGNGAASVFSSTGTGWVEQGPALSGDGEAGEGFGGSVALSFDGSVAVVGAGQAKSHDGLTWLFERSGSSSSWGAAQEKLSTDLPGRGALQFGSGVALSADAETVLVGARSEERAGAAWVFGPAPSISAVTPSKGAAAGGTKVTITGEHLSGALAVRFNSTDASNVTVEPGGKTITAESPPGTAGTVDITVETPVAVSAPNAGDRFTYEGEGGGEGGGGGGGGGGNPGGGNPKPGNKQPPTNPATTNTNTGLLSQFATGSEIVVLSFGPNAHPTCNVSLLSSGIAVQAHARALVRLKAVGAGSCHGTLTLKVKLKSGKRRSRLKAIATARFSLAAGKLATVKLALNASGRALLRAGHGHLTASLVVLKSVPAPTQARTARVRLTRRPATPSKTPASR
jgi:hypothetical protein